MVYPVAAVSSFIIEESKAVRVARKLMPWVIVGLSLLIYLLTLSRHYTADSLLYALDIENGTFRDLVDPTHLALHPVGWTWYQLWKLFGWNKGSILPLAALNALAGAICVGLVLLVALRLSKNMMTSMLIASGFAVSGGTWLLSVEAEFVTVPLMSSLLVLYLLIGSPDSIRNSRYYPTALGIVTAVAILMYASNILLVLIVGSVLWIKHGPSRKMQITSIISYLRPVIIFSVPILVAGIWIWTDGNWSMITQFRGSDSYGRIGWINIPQGIYAFTRTIVLYRGLAMNDSTELFIRETASIERVFFFFYYGMAMVVASIPLLLALRFRAELVNKYRVPVVSLIIWSILYALFAFVWVPGDISFWMPVLIAWWLLFCMIVTVVSSPSDRSRIVLRASIGIFVAILLVANAAMVILPRRDLSTNSYYQIARAINHQTDSDAIVLADESMVETLYLAYFSERAVIPVNSIDLENAELVFSSRWLNPDNSDVQRQAYIFKNGSLSKLEP